MKIISFIESPEQSKNPKNTDLLNVNVRYDSGDVGVVYIYRANLLVLQMKEKLIDKGISEKEVDDFIEACREAYEADHLYDED